jgi:hypothetical protein
MDIKFGLVYTKIKLAAIFLQEFDKIKNDFLSNLDLIDQLPNNPPFKKFIKIRIIHNQKDDIINDMNIFFNEWITNSNGYIVTPNFETKRRVYPRNKYINIITNLLKANE